MKDTTRIAVNSRDQFFDALNVSIEASRKDEACTHVIFIAYEHNKDTASSGAKIVHNFADEWDFIQFLNQFSVTLAQNYIESEGDEPRN